MWLEQVTGVPAYILVLALLASATRIFLAAEAINVKGILGIIASSMLLAVAAYPMLVDEDYAKGLITFLIAVGSFLAKDIGEFMIRLSNQLKKDPLKFVRDLLNYWRPKGPNGD